MEKVNQYLLAALAVHWRVALCGPSGCRGFAPESALVQETPIRPLAAFLSMTMAKALALCVWRRPRLVMAGSGLTAPVAWLAGRAAGARVVVYLHGLDIIAPSRIYQRTWLPFIRRCDLVLVNSANTARLATDNGVAATAIRILHPGTVTPEPDPAAGAEFRVRHGLGQRPVLLSVGRLTRRKGLAEFVSAALPDIAARRPDVLLIVVGEEASDALHGASGSERQRIEQAAASAGVAENLRFIGRLEDAGLAAAYQGADCHVFPVLDLPGDVEGFGMVALESAAHGLPTVAFDVGGVSDAVARGSSGLLTEAGNYRMFGDAVAAVLDPERTGIDAQSCREFARDKSWERFSARLGELLGVGHD
jgi:phosphatidylinositol alpha-1,6-mannosyltransferase